VDALQTWIKATIIGGAALMAVASAEADFKLPNPFAKKKPPTAETYTVTDDTAAEPQPKKSLPLPSLPKVSLAPKKPKRQAVEADKPSTWDKIGQSTKKFFLDAKDVLFPWTANPSAKTAHRAFGRTRVTGTQRVYSGSPSGRQDESDMSGTSRPSIGKSQTLDADSGSNPEDSPQQVTDFLKQPRIGFE
jgi:hypothetical protein